MVKMSHDAPMGFGAAFTRLLAGMQMTDREFAGKLHMTPSKVRVALALPDMPVDTVVAWCAALNVPIQTVCGMAYGGCGVSTDAGAMLRKLYQQASEDQQSTSGTDANILYGYGRLCGLAQAYLHLPDSMDTDINGKPIHKPLGRQPITYFELWKPDHA